MVTLTHFLEGNPLPPHRLLFSISSKGSFICTFPSTEQYIPRPLINQLWTTGWNGKYVNRYVKQLLVIDLIASCIPSVHVVLIP